MPCHVTFGLRATVIGERFKASGRWGLEVKEDYSSSKETLNPKP